MALHFCPRCGTPLTADDTADAFCSACRTPIQSPTTPASGLLAGLMRRFERLVETPYGIPLLKVVVPMLLMVPFIAFLVMQDLYIDRFWHGVQVTIDNATADPVHVQLDGKPVLTVGPRQSGKFTCRPGDSRITVLQVGKKTYDQVQTLKLPEQRKTARYVLNPDGTHRYWVRAVHYGDPLPTSQATNPEIEGRLQDLGNQIHLVEEPGPWYLAKVDIVLDERVPESVKVERFKSARRIVFSRIDAFDYDRLLKARNPSELFPLPENLGDDPAVRLAAEEERNHKLEEEVLYLEGVVSQLRGE